MSDEYEAIETQDTPLFFYEFIGEATFDDSSKMNEYIELYNEDKEENNDLQGLSR